MNFKKLPSQNYDVDNNQNIRIEKSKVSDIPAINAVIKASKSYWPYDPKYVEEALKLLCIDTQWLDNHLGYTIFCDHVCGFMGVEIHEVQWHLEHLWINPSHIRRGLGRLAVNRLLQEADKAGIHKITLLPDPPAEDFYLKLGAEFTDKKYPSRIVGGPLFQEMQFRL